MHHGNGEDLIDDSLKNLERDFGDEFVRIHRTALVAVRQIDALKKTSEGHTLVTLRNGSQDEHDALIISRRHLADVRRRIRAT
ncbi:MAG: LytTR family transcriptional regulator DNA-binding domain-containing protein [Woeseiaceae bacterium]